MLQDQREQLLGTFTTVTVDASSAAETFLAVFFVFSMSVGWF
jgi:hypothetical protein